jgi:hypothetical protein
MVEDLPPADDLMMANNVIMVDLLGEEPTAGPSSVTLPGVDGRTKAQRKSAKYNERRKKKNIFAGGGVTKAGHDRPCPLCPRKFHRNGVINHL